jgi:peptidoglycan/xylan/chitin deacetylase (PgdA/CDA1 family)
VLRDKEAFIVELATYNRGLKQERDRLLQTQQNSQKTPEVETKLLSARQSTGAIILAYHRIAALQPDTHDLCVQPDSFRQQVRYLHEACRPMRLEDLYRAATDGKLPPRAVALSFDDGTLDALTTAAPILQDAGVPGTFFVNSERLEEKHEAWHDTVERVLLSGPLPAQLKLILPDQEIMLATETREQRLQALRTVHGPLMLMLPDERAEVTAQIVAWSGRQMPPRDSHRLLLADEIRQLARVPGCRVGSHSANHLLLTGHTAEVQRDQVLACKHRLEEITQRPALAFSYPYGESSPELAHLVRTAGHPLAVTVNPGLVTATSDPMHLPRHLVRECPLSDFIAQIEQAFKELPEPGAHEAAQ